MIEYTRKLQISITNVVSTLKRIEKLKNNDTPFNDTPFNEEVSQIMNKILRKELENIGKYFILSNKDILPFNITKKMLDEL